MSKLVTRLPTETTVPLGVDLQEARFKMRSISAKNNYIIELPRAAFQSEKNGKAAPDFHLSMVKIQSSYAENKYLDTIEAIKKLLDFYPDSVRLYQVKGATHIRIGKLQLAKEAWDKAVDLAPEDKLLRRGLERLSQRLLSSR